MSAMKNITQIVEQVAAMIPNAEERAKLTNEKLVAGLKKIGIATREEVEALEERIAELESELAELRSSAQTKATSSERTARANGKTKTTTAAESTTDTSQ